MNRRTIILLILFSSFLVSCSSLSKTTFLDSQDNHYRIERIKRMKSVYLIYAKKGDSTYLIMSSRNNYPFNKVNSKIKVGNFYQLNLERIFPHDSIFGEPVMWNLNVGMSLPSGKIIFPQKKVHYSVYEANNLCGLSVVNSNCNSIVSIGHNVSVNVDTTSLTTGYLHLLHINITNTDNEDLALFISKDPITNAGQEHVIRRIVLTKIENKSFLDCVYLNERFDGFNTKSKTPAVIIKFLEPGDVFSTVLLSHNTFIPLSNHLFCVKKKELEEYLETTIPDSLSYNKSMIVY